MVPCHSYRGFYLQGRRVVSRDDDSSSSMELGVVGSKTSEEEIRTLNKVLERGNSY